MTRKMKGAADGLSLAAAPTFAAMALVTAAGGAGPLDMLCSAGPGASWLGGMVPMYVLMTAFHAGPWLKLIALTRTLTRTASPRSWWAPAWRAEPSARTCRNNEGCATGMARFKPDACAAEASIGRS